MIKQEGIWIGIFLAVLAAALGTTSKQLIALSSHLKKAWIFHLGAGINILIGPVVDASAYAFAPQVIVAPFACLDVIFNAITAPYTLRWQAEKLTRNHLVGTILVSVGAIFTSVLAEQQNTIYDVRQLEAQLFYRPTSLTYLGLELAAIFTIESAIRGKLLSPAIRGIALGVIAGMLMGNVFFMKGLIGIIQTTSASNYDAWLRPTPYILAAAAAGGAVFGHIFMRKGLGEYKGVFMVTIFEGAHISTACLSGCVVMEEMAGAPWWRYILYWVSVSAIVMGLLVINLRAAEAQMDETEEKVVESKIESKIAKENKIHKKDRNPLEEQPLFHIAQAYQDYICPSCGAASPDKAMFCMMCGLKRPEVSVLRLPEDPSKARRSPRDTSKSATPRGDTSTFGCPQEELEDRSFAGAVEMEEARAGHGYQTSGATLPAGELQADGQAYELPTAGEPVASP